MNMNDYTRDECKTNSMFLLALDNRLSILIWLAILISFIVCITVPRLSGIRTLAGAVILRMIFTLGIIPTCKFKTQLLIHYLFFLENFHLRKYLRCYFLALKLSFIYIFYKKKLHKKQYYWQLK